MIGTEHGLDFQDVPLREAPNRFVHAFPHHGGQLARPIGEKQRQIRFPAPPLPHLDLLGQKVGRDGLTVQKLRNEGLGHEDPLVFESRPPPEVVA